MWETLFNLEPRADGSREKQRLAAIACSRRASSKRGREDTGETGRYSLRVMHDPAIQIGQAMAPSLDVGRLRSADILEGV